MNNKRDALSALIDTCEADVAVLTETWLSAKIENHEIFNCEKKYVFYRCDRRTRSGGGVLIAVKDCLRSFSVPVVSTLELVAVCVRINHKDVVCGCYRPPYLTTGFSNELHDVLNKLRLRFRAASLLLLGDFNFQNVSWSPPFPTLSPASPESTSFLNMCLDFNLIQLVNTQTRTTLASSTVLDLVLTTHPQVVKSLSVMPGVSDHFAVHFNMTKTVEKTESTKFFRDYKRADYAAINNALQGFLSDYFSHFAERSVQENWNLFKSKVQELTNRYIPLRRIRQNAKSPWYTPTLKRLLNKKKTDLSTSKTNKQRSKIVCLSSCR